MKVIKTPGKYNGSQVAPNWIPKGFDLDKKESIVVMRGPMDIKREEMVDLEDLKRLYPALNIIHLLVDTTSDLEDEWYVIDKVTR